MSEQDKRLLEKQLWAIANVLRGKMNADEYKSYILGFIFYKYLSERLEQYINDKLLTREEFSFAAINENTADGKLVVEEVRKACVGHLGFFLKPKELFSYLVKKGNGEIRGLDTFILENLKNVLNAIEQTSMGTASEDDFKGLFDDVDLTSSKLGKTEAKKNEVIVQVLTLLSGIDFKLEDTKSDLLGDAYEYLIGEFAAGAGKTGGEFYTPAQVSRLLARIVTEGKQRLKSVYDPTCGSGSLLLRIGDYSNVTDYYGQELNPTTYNLGRMNMILHGVHFDHFSIRQGDALTDDMHAGLQAEAVVANPPFSAKWEGDSDALLASDERFSQYGRLAPKGAADYAFVTHMLYHLAESGTMAVILPHGALYRGGAEKAIRKYLITKLNCLDAVIGLPEDIFYGTDIETCILVFKKCREQSDDVLFIDASGGYGKGALQNYLRDEDIESIFAAFKTRTVRKRFSYRASINEIIGNDFYLNVSRYVKKTETEKRVDLNEVCDSFNEVEKRVKDVENDMRNLGKELGVSIPLGGGVSTKLLTQEIRFRKGNGDKYTEWRPTKLKDLLVESKKRNTDNFYTEVFSVAKEKGVINQIKHLGRSYAAEDISNYKVVEPFDIVYTKSPTAGFPFGIIKQNKTGRTGVVSVLYAVFKPRDKEVGLLLDYYFSSWVNTLNYLRPIVNKGAKNTMNINNEVFLRGADINLPTETEEICKITAALHLIDCRLELLTWQLERMQEYKVGLMQGLINT